MRFLILLAVLLFAVSELVCSTMDQVQFQPRADEGYYLLYSSRIAEKGMAGYPGLLDQYAMDGQTNRFFPSPLRLVTLLLFAGVVRLAGASFTTLALLSLAVFLVLLVWMAVACRRAFGKWRTVWMLPVLAFSPLHLALARRALSDTLASFFLLASLWLFAFSMWDRSRSVRRWMVVSLFYAAAFLVKESAFLLMPISLIFLFWNGRNRKEPIPPIAACAVSVLPLGLAALAISAAGGVGVAWKVAQTFWSGAPINPYAQQFQNGPWFRFVVDFLLISPWPVLLYFVWLGLLAADPRRDPKQVFWAAVPVVSVFLASFFPYGKNIRVLMFLEMPIRMAAVFALQRLTGTEGPAPLRRQGVLAVFVVLLLAADLLSFRDLFVRAGIYDPVSSSLLVVRRFLPS